MYKIVWTLTYNDDFVSCATHLYLVMLMAFACLV